MLACCSVHLLWRIEYARWTDKSETGVRPWPGSRASTLYTPHTAKNVITASCCAVNVYRTPVSWRKLPVNVVAADEGSASMVSGLNIAAASIHDRPAKWTPMFLAGYTTTRRCLHNKHVFQTQLCDQFSVSRFNVSCRSLLLSRCCGIKVCCFSQMLHCRPVIRTNKLKPAELTQASHGMWSSAENAYYYAHVFREGFWPVK